MIEYGITALQTQPSLFKQMTISKIVDKQKHKELGYFNFFRNLKIKIYCIK